MTDLYIYKKKKKRLRDTLFQKKKKYYIYCEGNSVLGRVYVISNQQ